MPGLKNILAEARARKLPRALAVYGTSGFTILGATNLFSAKYGLSPRIFDTLVAILLCGLPVVVARRLTRGGDAPPSPQARRSETGVTAAAALVAAAATVFILVSPRRAAETVPPPSPPGVATIAVLPFLNLSENSEDAFFGDGVTEDIIAQLSKVGDLQVISRTSVQRFRDTKKPVRDIARELGATAILEGSVRRAGDRVRIVGQLVDARADRQVWAQTYDRKLADIFAIQSEVALEIARELKARLTTDERRRIEARPTDSVEAYALYIQGRQHYYLYTREDNERAIELFHRALAADPRYAPAYAGLGDAFAIRVQNFSFPATWLEESHKMSDRAVELDPSLAEGHKARGMAHIIAGETEKGLEAYARAVKLNPNYAPVVGNIGAVMMNRGRFDEALEWTRKAARLQPDNGVLFVNAGRQYFNLGYNRQARAWTEKALAANPRLASARIQLAYLDAFEGRLVEARAAVGRLLAADPDDVFALDATGDLALAAGDWKAAKEADGKLSALMSDRARPHNNLALALFKLGEKEKSRRLFDENIRFFESSPALAEEGSPYPYLLAQAAAALGRPEEAFRRLDQAWKQGGFARWIYLDPIFDGLRSDARFKASLAAMQARLEVMRRRVRALGLDE